MAQRPSTSLLEILADYTAYDAEESMYCQQLKQFLETTENAYDRSNLTAHVVADAWILTPDHQKVVLVEHIASGKWLAPGGHCDGDPDVYANALREVEEETGLKSDTLTSLGLWDINSGSIENRKKAHGIEPKHIHFDTCFIFIAKEQPLTISDESTNLRWVPISEISTLDYFPGHWRRVHKTTEKWGPLA